MQPSPTTVILEHDGNLWHSVTQAQAARPTRFGFSGTLLPGSYRLLAEAPAVALDGVSVSRFDIRMLVPEPILSQPLLLLIAYCLMRRRRTNS